MTQNLINRLQKSGWEREEIAEALNIIKKAKRNKHPHIKFLDKNVYWIFLVVVVALNYGVAVSIIPAMLTFRGLFLIFILGTMGYVFGLLLETTIRSIEHLETRHHVALGVLIPLIAMANIVVIGSISNNAVAALNFGFSHNLYFVGAVYSFFLVLPYIIMKFILKKGYYSERV